MTPHTEQLRQQVLLLAQEVAKLPTKEIPDQTRYPNKAQQETLLARAVTDLTHAAWALEEYNDGAMRTYDISLATPTL